MLKHLNNLINAHAIKHGIDWRGKELAKTGAVAGYGMGGMADGVGALAKADDLEKGAGGDWEREGYKLDHHLVDYKNGSKTIVVKAHHKDGPEVGRYSFSYHPDREGITSDIAGTSPEHRRKGLANAAYAYAEKATGKKLTNANKDTQSPSAKALWNSPNRKFGKSLEKSEEKVDTSEETPYLAGYSKDGKCIYIDKRLPKTMTLKDGRVVPIDKYLEVHEMTEKRLEDTKGYNYKFAHEQATGAERKAVEADGIPWDEYQKYMLSEVKKLAHLDSQVPKDIDLKPEHDYHDEKTIEQVKKLQKSLSNINDLLKL